MPGQPVSGAGGENGGVHSVLDFIADASSVKAQPVVSFAQRDIIQTLLQR